jgi:hypothetical protein
MRDINVTYKGNGNNKNKEQPWKKDLTMRVPWKFWIKISDDEKQKRINATREKKKVQRSLNATQIDSGAKVEATAPIIPSVVPTPTNNTDVSEIPTIRSIMSAQTQSHQTVAQLPPGIYTSQDGRQFTINTLRKIRITSASVNDNDNLCLIDGSTNNDLAGSCGKFYEISKYYV